MFCQHAQTQYLKLEEYTVIHIFKYGRSVTRIIHIKGLDVLWL